MNKKLQVFISSTYTDLIEERQAAVQAILDAGHIPAGMELFKAGKPQMKTICKWIDESDVYMLILGGRYGSIEEESGLSYTEREYKYALSKNMPVFAIVLKDNFLHIKAASRSANDIFEKDNIDKYEKFKDYVKSKIVKFVENTDQISSVIHSHLNTIFSDEDYKLTGWIRGTDANDTNISHCAVNSNTETCFGDYTFSELVDILLEKRLYKFTLLTSLRFLNPFDPFDPFLIQELNNPKDISLNIFIKYYNQFCSGVSLTAIPDNSWLYNTVCPFFEEYKLLEKNKTQSSIYQISKLGRLFYGKLKSDNYLQA